MFFEALPLSGVILSTASLHGCKTKRVAPNCKHNAGTTNLRSKICQGILLLKARLGGFKSSGVFGEAV